MQDESGKRGPIREQMRANIGLMATDLRVQFFTVDPVLCVEVSNRGCRFGSLIVTNGGAEKWIQIFDLDRYPIEGDIPKIRLPIREGGFVFLHGPIMMGSGFYISGSSQIGSLDQAGIGEDLNIFAQIYSV